MNERNNDKIEMLQRQIELRDGAMTALKRENEILSIVNKAQKRKYRTIILLMSALIIIETGISIYNLIF